MTAKHFSHLKYQKVCLGEAMESSQTKGNLQDVDRKGKAMQHRRLWIWLASITSFFVAFWWLDFRLVASHTPSEKNITTTSIGMEDQLPDAIQRGQTINLALTGEGPLVNALQKALMTEIKQAGIGDIQLVEAIVPKYQGPVLVVKAGRPGSLWMPFFVTSRVTVQVGYSSSGDTTLLGKTPVYMDNTDGPAMMMYGEYEVNDRSWGVISRLGYYHLLADYLAQRIVATLKDLYRVST
jgi:hypothetical protein